MLRLYDYLASGNGYKVRLVLAHLGLAYERIELDIDEGETRTAEFLARFPNGKVPALELEDGGVLWESNAIAFYLAEGTPLLPGERLDRARVLQWMFFEQYSHEPYIAVARYIVQHLELDEERRALLESKRAPGYRALGVMEGRLAAHDFLVRDRYSIADIALYAYTHVADEGGFDLAGFPAIRAWLARVREQPGHIPITQG
ncbi:MAG: glutathione S-transferase family protein [Gammaproteobacteria bacterium]|nr:glutathione S-transferase family protein [Gammaproteobacteria bacterium]